MNIAILTETFTPDINGVARTMEVVATELANRGHYVVVVMPKVKNREEFLPHTKYKKIEIKGVKIPNYPEAQIGLVYKNRLIKIFKENKIDAIYLATEGLLYYSGLKAAKNLGIKVNSGFHTHFEEYTDYFHLGFLKSFVKNKLKQLHNSTNKTLVPSEASLKKIKLLGITNGVIFGRGVYLELFNKDYKDNNWRFKITKGDLNKKIILSVGRVSSEKNLIKLKECSMLENAVLVIVGDGPYLKKLKIQIPNAVYLGFLRSKDLAKAYASSDIFVFPSLTETFGNVVLEAAASGLAIIGYNTGVLNSHFLNNYNAIVVENEDEFNNSLKNLLIDNDKRVFLASNAFEKAKELKWDAPIREFIKSFN